LESNRDYLKIHIYLSEECRRVIIGYYLRIISIDKKYYYFASLLMLLFLVIFRKMKLYQRVSASILLPYMFLVFVCTIVERKIRTNSSINLVPLWKLFSIIRSGKKKTWLWKEITLNIIMFIPFGTLVPLIFTDKKLKDILYMGIGTSCVIEVLQLIMKRGLCELDDVINNSIGVILGYVIYKTLQMMREFAQKR